MRQLIESAFRLSVMGWAVIARGKGVRFDFVLAAG